MKKFTWMMAFALVAVGLAGSDVSAQGCYGGVGGDGGTLSNNLFQQYYTQGSANLATAGMYPAPHPVPYKVGHTYSTYQPLMPHEMMWQHSRNYYNYYGPASAFYADPCVCGNGGGALNKTTVVWASNRTNHMGPLPGSIVPLAKVHSRILNRWYCLGGETGRNRCGGGCNGACGGVSGGCPTCVAENQNPSMAR